MTRIHHSMKQHDGASPRARRRKRGSVLVLAVAVLAVLAALAVSYVTVVRVDRRSTNAYQKQENLQQQVGVVTAYLQSLITADVYGNRIVNSATPRLFQNNPDLPNWPKAFEDGEFMDVPWTDAGQTSLGTGSPSYTWNTAFPGQPPTPNALLRPTLGERSFADDAWLAPIEPIDTGPASNEGFEWDTWTQITNLRSAYRYNDDLSQQSGMPVWVRDNGRYVDLAQFLLQSPPNFTSGVRPGFPGANLQFSQFGTPWQDPTSNNQQNGPNLGVNQRIFDLQMADLQETFYWPSSAPNPPQQGQREFLPADERFWVDTDGDGRPDARWQELDLLGNAFGLRWVVAARIIDNSALANVNSHIAFGYPNGSNFAGDELYGDGRTPADVDLFRLIASQIFDSRGFNPSTGSTDFTAHPDIRLGGNLLNYSQGAAVDSALDRAWQIFLNRGVRAPNILEQLQQLQNDGVLTLGRPNEFLNNWPGGQLYGDPMANPNPDLIQALDVKRFERAHVWRYFGSNPFNPFATSGLAFPLRDEIDLRAYSGFNLLSYVSRLEQRIDGGAGNNSLGFLPGSQPLYSDFVNGPGLGALRSKEWDLISESPRTFRNFFALQPQAGQYTNQAKLERLRKDIRHLLTTISGEGPIGPVPVLNPAEEFDRVYRTRKVDLNRFTTPDFMVNSDRIRESLENAFQAFVWALAPLATNQPLMSPLDQIVAQGGPMAYGQLAQDVDLHYGGGDGSATSVEGPARVIADLYGINGDQVGSAYAIHRAASLVANLADAVDGQTMPGGPGADPTIERPTIVRFFNQINIDSMLSNNDPLAMWLGEHGAIPLGTRFAHGDIWPDPANTPLEVSPGQNFGALPPEMVGDSNTGVTFVGLDRQPFFREVVSVAVYSDILEDAGGESEPNQDGIITPGDPTEQLGSILAFELGNPWPEAISLADYEILLPLDGTPAILDLPDDEVIAPGDFKIFYFTNPELGVNGAFDTVVASWLATAGEDAVALDATALADPTIAMQPIVFDPGVIDDLPAILRFNIGSVSIPLDRISPPAGGRFPRALEQAVVFEDLTGAPTPGRVATGRIVVAESVTRAVSPGPAGGFPRYVIEFSEDDVNTQLDESLFIQTIFAPEMGGLGVFDDAPGGNVEGTFISEFDVDLHSLGDDPKPADTNAPDLPAFELFVPNGALYATSELGQVSTLAHTFIHQSQSEKLEDFEPVRDPSRWLTFSELMGLRAHYRYDAMAEGSVNPYLGVLDFSRFILGFGGDLVDPMTPTLGSFMPDALTAPLATRVFDGFVALPTPDGVIRGRVNVNTAPRKILELLPMVDPRDPFTGNLLTDIESWMPAAPTLGFSRVDLLEKYRSRDNSPHGDNYLPDVTVPEQTLTFLDGLRRPGMNAPWSLGFSSAGEIATLGVWNNPPDGGFTSTPGDMGFMELGGVSNSQNAPLDLRQLPVFEAENDPEERLALFRAISNIVSTRSDIFTAWFVIRAYDPKDIEAIQIPTDIQGNENAIASLMNPGNPLGLSGVSEDNPGLLPAFERRVLVIFDRSNVQRPSDRPEVLLQVELPLN